MKPNRKPYALLLAGAFLLAQAGCKDLLDLKPQDRIEDADFWQTPNDFMLAANNLYTFERSFVQVVIDNVPNSNTSLAPTQNYHADHKGDLVAAQNVYSRGLNTILPTDPNYNTAYTRIRTINYLLDKAQTYARPDDIKQYAAEARFFRAYVYFDLLQTYGGVPIVDKLLAPDSPDLQAPRNTRDEVVDFIIRDLEAALPDVPAKAAQPSTELGRINKETVQAFLGRVTLYEGTWQKFRGNSGRATPLLDKSIVASGTVVSGRQYSLFAPAVLGDSAQKYLFILENQRSNPASVSKSVNNEYILANRYDQAARQVRSFVSRPAQQLSLTRTFANLYLCQDGLPVDKSPLFRGYATLTSEFVNRDNRMRYNMKKPRNTYWYSGGNARVNWTGDAADRAAGQPFVVSTTPSGYGNQKWVAERAFPDNEEGYDYPVIRLAEVLLNYAEALYERNGNISNADLDLTVNLVRQRVNRTMPKLSNAFVGANGLDMRTEIRRERTIELYLEGFRVDDLKRWNAAVVELRKPLTGIKWVGTQFQTEWPAQSATPKDAEGNIVVDGSRSFSEKNYLIPLPSQQLQLNPQLQQNPGW
ncbi:MAG: RagB/SusD family nutrient uptake outer membrane protein [Hymenobacter sp.]|nr:RagB/SusD family nutrient uptake outer membrane protein [Hymenobacter sp.]